MSGARSNHWLAAALLLAGPGLLALAPPAGARRLQARQPDPGEICFRQDDCKKTELCSKPTGGCGAEVRGRCRPRPEVCPSVYDPVCGCDGETYSNECEAARARAVVASRGACVQPCRANGDCERGTYCAKERGQCLGAGRCRSIPDVCPEVFDPVCGCDGKTYGNECRAAKAGVPVASRGECVQPCRANDDCRRGTYCAKERGQCAAAGRCRQLPDVCPEVFDPVCGCDRKTYGNECRAAKAGVPVASRGECPGIRLRQ